MKDKKLLHGIVFFLLALLFVIFVFIPSVNKVNTDFPNYYISSNMLMDGKDLRSAYDNVEFNKQLLLYGIENQIVSFIPYPPVNALLLLPFAKLEPLTAKLLWNVLNAVFLLACIYILSRLTEFNFYTIGIIFLLSGYALVNNFMFGQAYLLVLLCLCLSIYFMVRSNDVLSGLFIAMSVVLKFFTIFFIFLFIFKKRLKLLVYMIVFIIVLYVPIVLITGIDTNLFYFSNFMLRLGDGWVGTVYAVEYQSFFSLIHKLFHFEPVLNPNPLVHSNWLFYFFKYVFIFGILTVSLPYLRKHDENIKLEISLFCIIALLLLPVNASYQYVVLIPAIIFLVEHYHKENDKIMIAALLFILFFVNSPAQVWIVNKTKDTIFFILGYVKLFALLYLWILNLRILAKRTETPFFNPVLRKFGIIGAIHIVALTIMSSLGNATKEDNANVVMQNPNYMLSMPSALNTAQEKVIYTECVNDKFVLNSNFGFSYNNENVFNPVLLDMDNIAFETVINKKIVNKLLNVHTGQSALINKSHTANISLSKDGKMKCFVMDGQVFLEDVKTNKVTQLTSGRQMNSFPVFAYNDTKIIFCSDRSRGVGFTTLYEIDINNVKQAE